MTTPLRTVKIKLFEGDTAEAVETAFNEWRDANAEESTLDEFKLAASSDTVYLLVYYVE